ncbi:hypothetical protein Sru01_35140 [Sphaerisporangium rufum]|uniref:Uncharacterized protein n=1 Tax=Sphaerisporangium rufum TaxID=1381558 RepID=A0A919R7D3_9ACTN|nr:hypothetical protein Sru01_35140 [Sphaerisporangium rufum]
MIACDIRIFERPNEYQAYLRANVAVFLLPGESKIAERLELIQINLAAMCGEAGQLRAGVWQLTARALIPYRAPAAGRKRGDRSRT